MKNKGELPGPSGGKESSCQQGDMDSILEDPTYHEVLSPGPTAVEPLLWSPGAATTEAAPRNPHGSLCALSPCSMTKGATQ